MTPQLKEKIEEEIVKMANKALRTICIGYKEINGDEGKEIIPKINKLTVLDRLYY